MHNSDKQAAFSRQLGARHHLAGFVDGGKVAIRVGAYKFWRVAPDLAQIDRVARIVKDWGSP